MIPKIRHLIWLGDMPVPEPMKAMTDTFLSFHPDWRTETWTDRRLPDMLCQDIFDEQQTLIGRIELLRIELLFRYGGMHTDWDFVWQNSVERAVGTLDAFACTAINGMRGELILESALMGFTPGHRILQKAIAMMFRDFKENRGQLNICASWYIAQAIGELWKFDLEAVKDFRVLDADKFCPFTLQNGRHVDDEFPAAVAVHKYSGLWLDQ